MQPINSNYNIPTFNKTIQLYGDRSGGQGNFEFAGFAELQEMKVVLLKGNDDSLENQSDWRRLVRLIHLAQRIEKPVLLWNLPLSKKANNQHPKPLALGTVIQNTKMRLLNLQQPIITVFDEMYNYNDVFWEGEWGDGAVLVNPKENSKPQKIIKQNNLIVVSKHEDIAEQILILLNALSKISVTELVANRLKSLSLTEI